MSDYIIGLTGGIASGKSALEKEFVALGIFVADADVIARQIVEPGQPALDAVVRAFGTSILTVDGSLDRTALRAVIFDDTSARALLESILHPIIRVRLHEQCREAAGPYSIAVIPLLAEGSGRGNYPWLDRIIVVDAPQATQKKRLMRREKIDATLAEKMIAAQSTRAERLALADDIVVNDGEWSTLGQAAIELDSRYRVLARS